MSTLDLKNNSKTSRTIDVEMIMQITHNVGIPDATVGRLEGKIILKSGESKKIKFDSNFVKKFDLNFAKKI